MQRPDHCEKLFDSHSVSLASSTSMLFTSVLQWILHYLGRNEANPSHSSAFAIPGPVVYYKRILQGSEEKLRTAVSCRKSTQVFMNESGVCQHLLFPVLNVNSRSSVSNILAKHIFLYLDIHMYTYNIIVDYVLILYKYPRYVLNNFLIQYPRNLSS